MKQPACTLRRSLAMHERLIPRTHIHLCGSQGIGKILAITIQCPKTRQSTDCQLMTLLVPTAALIMQRKHSDDALPRKESRLALDHALRLHE